MTHRPDAKHQQLGARMGPRMAKVMVDALSDHMTRTAGTRAKIGTEAALGVFRTMTQEKLQHVTPFTATLLGHSETPDEVEKLLRFITHGSGELSELLNTVGVGSSFATGIASALSNYLAPAIQDLIRERPNSLLDPGTAAAAHEAGWMDTNWAMDEGNRAGINNARMEVLTAMAKVWPGVAEILEFHRRGYIPNGVVVELLRKQRIPQDIAEHYLALSREHLQPADAALMALRSIISEGEGAGIAAMHGITSGDFDLLVKATGEPPGLMQLLEAYRRGFINQERLEKGVRESRVRDEWMDVVERLRFTPASASDALRGVIQGHLSDTEGKQIAEWNGLRPEDWEWLRETEGNPPGVEQMLKLYNRGVVSEQQVTEAIKESHLKNKYIAPVKHLAVTLPQGRQITTMIGRGAISEAEGMELLRDLGYTPSVAHGLLASATSAQVAREKVLAVGQITELYHDHAITEGAALKGLEALGYHPENAKLVLHLTDLKRERALMEAAISPVKSSYIAHHITESEASNDLDKLGVSSTQRDFMLSLWAVERFAHRKSLTEAQIVKANEKGLFTDQVALTRLVNLGYTEEDAKIILDLEKTRTTPA